MFKNLSERLTGIFDKLKSRGSLNESDVDTALREVRIALLEADVSLETVKEFLDKAKKKAIEQLNVKDFGIDVDIYKELIHIVEIPEMFENYSKMILDKVATLPSESEIRIISTHNFDFDEEEKTDRMAEIEQCVDDDFHNINGNFVCSFQVNQINEKIRSRFLNQLLDSHHAVVFLRNEKGADVFTLP